MYFGACDQKEPEDPWKQEGSSGLLGVFIKPKHASVKVEKSLRSSFPSESNCKITVLVQIIQSIS
jgi:hypothetical protein